METTQQQFDAFVADHGAEATIAAINGHVHPDGNGCSDTGCPKGYVCASGVCKLDIGN